MKQTAIPLCICCATLLTSLGSAHAQTADYRYTYMTLTPNGQVPITTIDPIARSVQTKTIQMYPEGSEVNIYPSWVSPNANWIALDYQNGVPSNADTFRLVNVQTGKIQDISRKLVLLVNLPLDTLPDQAVAWSPNGQYIAFTEGTGSGNDIKPYLFNLKANVLVPLNVDQNQSLRFAWSRDSAQLVIEGGRVISQQGAYHYTSLLDVIDIATNKVTQSLDVSNLGNDYTTSVCQLNWSPDATYISFVSTCDPSVNTAAREVYLWRVSEKRITPITSITSQMVAQAVDPGNISATYTLNWLSAQHLLIGMFITDYKSGQSPYELLQSVLYDTSSMKLSPFTSGQVQDIKIAPVSGKIALSVASSYKQDPPDYQQKLTNFKTVISGNVTSDNINSLSSVQNSGPAGKLIGWSPDGKLLAYQQMDNSTFAFITDSAPPSVMYTYSDPAVSAAVTSKSLVILPIGWVEAGTLGMTTPITQPTNGPIQNGTSVPGGNQIGGG